MAESLEPMTPLSKIDRPALMTWFAIVLWGIMANMLELSIVLALPAALAIFKTFPQKVQEAQLRSLTEFCFVALFAGYFVINNNIDKPLDSLLLLFKITPLFFYPVVLCRFLGGLHTTALKTLFVPLRYRNIDPLAFGEERCDLAWLYSFLLLLCASSKEGLYPSLYFPLCALWAIAAMISSVPKHGSLLPRCLALAISIILGFSLQLGLHHGEIYMEQQGREWLQNQNAPDGLLSQSTLIGQTAKLQNSEKILLRYKSSIPQQEPIYLRSSVFDVFVGKDTWMSSEKLVELKIPEDGWVERELIATDKAPDVLSLPPPVATAQVKLNPTGELWLSNSGKCWLPLPDLALTYRSPLSEKQQRSGEDRIRCHSKVNILHVQLIEGKKNPINTAPGQQYSNLFDNTTPILEAFLQKNQIASKATLQSLLPQLQQVFSKFEYSLDLKASPENSHPLENFLFKTKSGHCEYFATASVLLLRYCGYPARYCSGFVCKEKLGAWHIARGQDAHAWAEVWDGQQWLIVENTPSAHLPISTLRPLFNLWSEFMLFIDEWRYQDGEDRLFNNAPWILALVLIYFSYRLVQEWLKHRQKSKSAPLFITPQEPDPGFLQLEKSLAKKGYPRYAHETWAQWQARLFRETQQMLISHEQVKLWNDWHWGEKRMDPNSAKKILG